MYVLILDTETTGLFPRGAASTPEGATSAPLRPPPRKSVTEGAPILNPSAQIRGNNNKSPLPYAVQISYAIIDTSSPFFPIVEDYDAIIRISEETPLPAESVAIHGITREMIRAKGVPIEHVLSILQRSLDTYDIQLVVGHNIAFDLRVLETERGRQGGGVERPPQTPSVHKVAYPSFSPSSSPDPTSTPEGATSTPFNPSMHKGLRPGTDSNTFAPTPQVQAGRLTHLPSFCTARESVGVCNLRVESMYGGVYLKFGKLGYVFEILFKERDAARGVDMKVFEKYMHNSRVDVLMCARVYVWLCYSVDVFDAWYREMQNYADENFINVDDSHLVGGGGVEHPFETPICAEGFKGALDAPSPRRSDRLRLKRMLVQEQGSVLAY